MTDYAARGMAERPTRQEAADYMRVSLRFVEALIADGELDEIRLGRKSFVPMESVKAYLDRHRVNAKPVSESGDRRLRSVA